MAVADPLSASPEEDRKRLRKLERALARAEERLVDYERMVDQTQHLLNTRIHEIEEARAALSARTDELEESETRFRQLAEAAFEAILISRLVEDHPVEVTLEALRVIQPDSVAKSRDPR